MYNKLFLKTLTTFFVLIGVALAAAGESKRDSEIEVLPRELEVELALSAAPKHLRAEAGVYVLEKNGYAQVRESKNGFICIVTRPDFGIQEGAFEPMCLSPEAVRVYLEVILENAKLRAQGKSLEELNRIISNGYATGKYETPSKPGVIYMLSPINRVGANTGKNFLPGAGDGVIPVHPHIMYFGFNVSREELGLLGMRDQKRPAWLPLLTGQNRPFSWIVTFIDPKAVQEIMNAPGSIALTKKMQKYLKQG